MIYGVDMFAGTVDFLRSSKKNEYKGNSEIQERLSKSSDSMENAWRKEVRSDVEEICWKCRFEKWRWRLEREEKTSEGEKILVEELQRQERDEQTRLV